MFGKTDGETKSRHTTYYALMVCLFVLVGATHALAGGPNPPPPDIVYTYDSNYQVERADYQTDGYKADYVYDTMGNRLSMTAYASSASNNPPGSFTLVSPGSGTNTSLFVTLTWNASTDPNAGDTVSYELYFGRSSGNLECVYKGSETSYEADYLDPNTTYYWTVYAVDSHRAKTQTTNGVWNFTTEDAKILEVMSSDSAGLQSALTSAQTDGKADVIRIAGGSYLLSDNGGTHFSFSSIDSDSIYITGGYSPDFATHDPKKYPTTLDGRGISLDGDGGILSVVLTGATYGNTLVTINDLAIRNGSATGNGGGLSVSMNSADLEISDMVVNNCKSAGSGGGIYVIMSPPANEIATLTFERNKVSYNTADGSGGGFYAKTADSSNGAGSIIANNNVINGNVSSGSGGGFYLDYRSGFFSILNNTIVLNKCGVSGGGAYITTDPAMSTFTMKNNLLDLNSGLSLGEEFYFPGITNTMGGYVITYNYLDTSRIYLPVLPLSAYYVYNIYDELNGAGMLDSEHDDCRLTDGSICRDAGTSSSLTADIEGNPRNDGGGVDIGAYEYTTPQPPYATPVVTVTAPSTNAVISGSSYTITGAASSPVGNNITSVDVSTNGVDWYAANDTSGNSSWNTWEYVWTVPADGTYTIYARASDGSNTGQSTGCLITVDNTHTVTCQVYTEGAGTVTFDPASSGNIYTHGDTVSLTVSPGTGFYWLGDATGSDSPLTLTVDSDKVLAVNFGSDAHAPVSSISSPADNSTVAGTSIMVMGTSSDAGSGVSSVEVDCGDGTGWHTVSGTTAWSYTWTPPSDGTYTVRTRATDVAGNIENTSAEVTVTVDNTPPSSGILTPADGGYLSGTLYTIIGTASDSGSGISKVEVDTGDGTGWNTASGTTNWSYVWNLPSEGTYTVRTRVTDIGGTVEDPSPGVTVVVDNTSPNINSFVIDGNAPYADTSVTLTIDASDANGAAEMRFSNDASSGWSAWTGYASDYAWTLTSGDGEKTVYAQVRDLAGNVSAQLSDTIVLDTISPAGTFTINNGTSITSDASVTINSAVTDANGMAEMRFENGTSGWSAWVDYADTYTWDLADGEGFYHVQGQFMDVTGNILTLSDNITYDYSPPASEINSPPDGNYLAGTTCTITVTSNDSVSPLNTVEINTGDGTGWHTVATTAYSEISTIDGTGYDGSLVIDADGNEHVSYYDHVNDDLKYATNESGTWVTSTIDSDGDVGRHCSLAVDSNGKAHISYYNYTNYDLKYATNKTGTWVVSTIDSTGNVGQYTSIAVDPDGGVYVSYYEEAGNYDLKYATNKTGTWVVSTIDSTGNVGKYTSLVLDSNGHAHISYYDDTYYDLKYATNETGIWVVSIIDNTGGVGGYTSLALDSNGHAHISYYDQSNTNLKYATKETGTWVVSTIDSAGSVGMYTSLALDANGKAHISYYDASQYDLKYATDVCGTWVTSTIDSTGSVGSDTSLMLDWKGDVRIIYSDNTNSAIKYYVSDSLRSDWNYTWNLPEDGTYNIVARATDAAGFVETPGTGINVTVDNNPPSSQITDPLDGETITDTVYTITGTADDNGTGVSKVEVSTDNGVTWNTAEGTTSWSYSWETPIDASYNIRMRATDVYGRIETPGAGIAVSVEARPPTTTATPPGSMYLARQWVKLGTDEPATVYYTTDGSEPTTSSTVYSAPFAVYSSTTVKFFAVDTAEKTETTKTENYTINRLPFWTEQLGSSAEDSVGGMAIDTNGNTYLTGYTKGGLGGYTNQGGYDLYVAKFDQGGVNLWTRQMGTTLDDYAYDVCVDVNGNAYVAGFTSGGLDGNFNLGGTDYFVVKYDTNGNKVWTKQYGTAASDQAQSIVLDGSGNILVSGNTLGAFPGNTMVGCQEIFIAKINASSGNVIWTKQHGKGDCNNHNDRWWYMFTQVTLDVNGNICMTGYMRSPGFWRVTFVAKFDPTGNFIWQDERIYGVYPIYNYGMGISTDSVGNIYVTGYANNPIEVGQTQIGGSDIFLLKYDTAGNRLWTRQLGTVNSDIANDIMVDAHDDLYVTGSTAGIMSGLSNTGGNDLLISKYGSGGLELWSKTLGTSESDSGSRIIKDANDNLYIAGSTSGGMDGEVNNGGVDGFVMKLSGTQMYSRVTSPASDAVINGDTVITGTASTDNGPALELVEVSTDGGGTWNAATDLSGGLWSSWEYVWTPTADGQYSLISRATDSNGKKEASSIGIAVTVEIIDTVPPISSISVPSDGGIVNGGSYTILGSAGDGTGDGVAEVEVSTDGGATWNAATGMPGGQWSSWSYAWTLPVDGVYTILSRATDAASNVETPSAGINVTVDNTIPSSAITAPADGVTLGGTSSTMITGTASDGSGSGIALVEVSTDGGANWAHATGTTSWNYTWMLSSDGNFSIKSRSTDNAGNIETPGAGVSVTVDITPPTATITDVPASLTTDNYATLTASGTDVVSYKYALDGGSESSETAVATQISLTDLPDGEHTVEVIGKDQYNNWQTTPTTATWTVDTTGPVLTLSTLPNGAVTTRPVLNVAGHATDEGSGINTLTINSVDISADAAEFSYAIPLSKGENVVTCAASDNLSNPTTITRTITFDPAAPQLTVTAPADNSKTQQGYIDVTGTADTNSTIVVKLNGNTQTVEQDGDTFSSTVTLASGLNAIEITATDQLSNTTTDKRSVTQVAVTEPSLAVADPGYDLRATQNSATIMGTVADTVGSVTVTVNGDDVSQSLVDGSFQKTVNFAAEGVFPVTVSASDSNGETIVTRNIIYKALSASLSPDPASKSNNPSSVTWTASADGGSGNYEYRFWYYDGTWHQVNNYSSNNAWAWNNPALGVYEIQCQVRNAGSTANYEAYVNYWNYSIYGSPLTFSMTHSPYSPVTTGTLVTWTITAGGGTGNYEYRFWLKEGGIWSIKQDYSSSNTWTWTPTSAGTYQIVGQVRNVGSTLGYDMQENSGDFVVQAP